MLRSVLGCLLCTVGVIGLVGCGGSGDPNRPKTVPASVTVTYKGQPAAGANVTFQPASADKQGAVAVTDPQGHAEMWTFDPGDGVIPGNYKVLVSKVTSVSLPDPDKTDPAEYKRLEKLAESTPPKNELPEKYNSATTSDLTAEVTDGGANSFTFDLKD